MTCQQDGCVEPGQDYLEPAGTWCSSHRPQLWKVVGSDWHSPRCWRCNAPAGYPNKPGPIVLTRPVCRAHAPQWMRPYLKHTDDQEQEPA